MELGCPVSTQTLCLELMRTDSLEYLVYRPASLGHPMGSPYTITEEKLNEISSKVPNNTEY